MPKSIKQSWKRIKTNKLIQCMGIAMMKICVNRRQILIILLILSIGILTLLGISKCSFQKACLRREIHWPDLEIADEWQYKIITEAYKIKNEPNREITITASDGVKLVGHYFERKKNAPIIIFFMDFGLIAMYVECQFTELQKSINGTSY